MVGLAVTPLGVTWGFTMLLKADLGWSGVAVLSCSWLAALAAWDRKLRWPRGIVAGLLALVAAVLAVFAAWPQIQPSVLQFSESQPAAMHGGVSQPCVPLALLATVSLVLWTHLRRSDQTRLVAFSLPLVPLLVASLPTLGGFLTDLCVETILGISGDLLNLANIPYSIHGDLLAISEQRFSIEHQLQGLAAWPALVAWGLLFSAMMGRNWIHLALNATFAFGLSIAYHCGCIAMISAAAVWGWTIPPSAAWPWICGAAVVIAFLSADRFWACLLAGIAPDENASQANPLIHAWNVIVLRRPCRRKTTPQAAWELPSMLATVLILLAAGGAYCRFLPGSIAQFASSGRNWTPASGLFEDLVENTRSVDHFPNDQQLQAELGQVADMWVFSAPEHVSRLVVMQKDFNPAGVPFSTEDWAVAIETQDDSASDEAADDETADDSTAFHVTRLSSTEKDSEARAVLWDCYLDAHGRPQATDFEPGALGPAVGRVRIYWLADMGAVRNPRIEAELAGKFEEAVATIGAQMVDVIHGSKPPASSGGPGGDRQVPAESPVSSETIITTETGQ